MQSGRVRGLLAAGLALGVLLLAKSHRDLEGSPPPNLYPETTEVGSVPLSAREAAAVTAMTSPSRSIVSSDDVPQDQANLLGWDELTSEARLDYLTKRFAVAVSAIEEGERDPQHLVVAQATLTSMRAELYGTPTGRAQHRKYEARLDGALGEVVPEKGVSK